MSQSTAQRSPLLLAGFVLLVTLALGAAAYGLNAVTNPQPVAVSKPATCQASGLAGHPKASPVRSYSSPPLCTPDPNKQYYATFSTVRGQFVVRLRTDTAPRTAANFIALANAGFYDGLTFHRVCPNPADTSCGGSLTIAQGGDPSGDGTGGPGYSIGDEGPKGPYGAGTIAMARSAQVSGSQFFIDTADNTSILGPQPQVYNVFGDIVVGLTNAQALQKGDKMDYVAVSITPPPSPSPAAGASPSASPSAAPTASPSAAAASPSPS